MYFAWSGLVFISLVVGMAAFLWGFRSGQFSDQERARYLPFPDELPETPARSASKSLWNTVALLAVAAVVLSCLLAPLAILYWRSKGTG
ncbi:MAG: cbb3-type cytochrome oxidase assembly protein [Syntrophobacteraceae bacterium]|nr:cbb3-type cytochrome oxidase assembly protein [Desulfobacteraceae bacterium]